MARMARAARRRTAAGYVAELRRRAKASRVYRRHQFFGLEIAAALNDERHKSLYIKLAKERGGGELLALAKDIAGRRNVKNRGAYFMTVLKKTFPATRGAAASRAGVSHAHARRNPRHRE